MTRKKIVWSLVAALMTPPSLFASPVWTGDTHLTSPLAEAIPGTSMSDSSRVHDIDEVVVVSQPKETLRLRRQPVSSSSYSQLELQRLHVDDLRSLSSYVPSLTIPAYGSRLTSSVYVRGIGSRINNPAVGLYVDGLPIVCKSAYNLHTYQLDRVDVLRGPQGTLYGQNTEGGLLRLYSRNPLRYHATDARLSWTTHFGREAELGHYGKISSRLAYGISAFYTGQNGALRNLHTGNRAERSNEAGGKLRLVYQPTSRLSFDLIADYQFVRQNAFPYGLLDGTSSEAQAPNTTFDNTYRRHVLLSGLTTKYKGRGFELTSTTSYQYLADNMRMDQDYLPADMMRLTERQWQNALTQELILKSTTDHFWHYTFGMFGSQQWLKTSAPIDFGEAMTTQIATPIQSAMKASMASSMAKRFVAQGMSEAAAYQMALQTIERAGGVSMDVTMAVPGLFHTPQLNLGVFHESHFDLTSRLTATLGLRYDYNHVKIGYDTEALMALKANVMGQEATNHLVSRLNHSTCNHFNQLLPKVGLSYRIDNQGSMLYAVTSKGYRAGGYNIQMFSDILQSELNANRANAMRGDYEVAHTADDYNRVDQTIAYKPETSWNYELGAHLNLLGNALHMDLAAYYMQVKNQQLSVMAGSYGFGRMMVNAGRSRSMGVEAALRGSAADDRLSWTVSYGYTHATFRQYRETQTLDGKDQEVDYRGKRVPYVPMHTLGATADYRLPLSGTTLRALTLGANVNAQGSIYWDEANTQSQPFYAVLGAHADLDMGVVQLSVWGRNLTQTRYNTFALSSGASGEKLWFGNRANPRQIGVDVRLHF